MFSRFRRSKVSLTARDPELRLEALNALGEVDARVQPQIDALAREDADDRVRRRALDLTADRALLEQLLDDDGFGDSAAARLLDLDPAYDTGHPRVIRAQLARGITPAAVSSANATGDELIELVLASRGDAQQALLARDAFRSAASLTRLERASRDRNKTANRFAREQLDTLRRLRAEAQTQSERFEELMDALEKHLRGDPATVGFTDKLKTLEARADSAEAALGELCATLEAHGEDTQNMRAVTARRQALPEAPPPPDPAPTAAPTGAGAAADAAATAPAGGTSSPFEALSTAFDALDARLAEDADFKAIAAERQRLTDAWLEAANSQPPGDGEHQIFERFSARFQELAAARERLEAFAPEATPALATSPAPDGKPAGSGDDDFWREVAATRRWLKTTRKGLKSLRWPAWAPADAALAALEEAVSSASKRLDAIDEHVAGQVGALEASISSLEAHIDEGASRAAQALLGEARRSLQTLPRAAAEPLRRALNQAAGRLGELKDWQTYATSPKRESLCEAMETLAATPLDAREQADRIKALRAEWNALGPPASGSDARLAERFNASAETAFEPCRAYFAEQAEERSANLEARKAICDQLQSYLQAADWASADLKAAEQILRTARGEWRRYHPVERRAAKAVDERFEALQAELHGHLKSAWDANLAAKEQIVREAEALLALEGAADRVNGAKALQQRWKAAGPAPRNPDQKLWRAFRKACDEIFDTLAAERQAADAALSSIQEQAQSALDTLAERLERDGASTELLKDSDVAVSALSALPDRLRRPLERRFDDLEREIRGALKARANAERAQALLAVVDEPATGEGDAELTDLRRLVIEAEIAADLESPTDDRDERMALQVEMMNAGLGGSSRRADARDLALRWRDLGTKPDAAAPLRDRLLVALKQLSGA